MTNTRASRTPLKSTRSLRSTPAKSETPADVQTEPATPSKTPTKRAATTPKTSSKKTPVPRSTRKGGHASSLDAENVEADGVYVLKDVSVLDSENDSDQLINEKDPAFKNSQEMLASDNDLETAENGAEQNTGETAQSLNVPKKHALDYSDSRDMENETVTVKKTRSSRKKVPESFMPAAEDEKEVQSAPQPIDHHTPLKSARGRPPKAAAKGLLPTSDDFAKAIVDEVIDQPKTDDAATAEAATFNPEFDFLKRVKEAAEAKDQAEACLPAADNKPSVSLNELEEEWKKALEEEKSVSEETPASGSVNSPLLMQEPLVRNGVAATLSLLYQKGILQKPIASATNSVPLSSMRNAGSGRSSEPSSVSSADYVPTFELRYTDEFGRELTPKEAFKKLCHRFHGKAPGKQKMDKLLKKIAEEKTLKKMAYGDAALKSSKSLQKKLEATGSAYIVLADK